MAKKEMHPLVKAERDVYEKMFDILIKDLDLSKPIIVLDYGSSTGGFASRLAERYPHIKVIAADSNPEAIKLGIEHYSHLNNLEFCLSQKIPPGSYDLIFNNLVLHELDKKGDKKSITSFLKEAYVSIKKGGLISVLDNRKVSKEDFKKIYEQNKSPRKRSFDEEYEEHNRYSTNDWTSMLEETGFYKEYDKKLPPNLFHYRGKKR
jgi:ubiquinone/menaquinone biosynthesis C-methylase UbiE